MTLAASSASYPGRSAARSDALQSRAPAFSISKRVGSRVSSAPLRHSASKTRVNTLMAARCTASGTRVIIALLAIALTLGAAVAQDYPTRPITLVVPFPAGGGNDALARVVAGSMSRTIGQQVVVENRGGAGGTIATRAVARTTPDGYTILLTYTGTLAINPTLYPNAGYDPRKDFAPIGLIGSQPSVLTVNPSLPVHSSAELVAYAKANPSKINYGFVPGTIGHVTTEMFMRSTGIELTKIPYKGNGPAIGDLLGGHVNMMVLSLSPILGNVKAGTLRALAVTTATRSALLPDVPTIAESAVPGFSAAIRYGIAAPGGTPKPIVERLSKELRAALAATEVRERMLGEGVDPISSTPEEYAADIDREETKWSAIVRQAGAKVE
jgi:tripartite-type tricarboxylate transporter receptor subunit TctC